jgi:uncharacterized protein (TIGR03118 family)
MSKFEKINLVSTIQYNANVLESRLIDPRGVVATYDSIWIAVNGSWTLQQYTLSGTFMKNVVVEAINDFNTPTGLVAYNGTSFSLSKKPTLSKEPSSQSSNLIVVNESGTINAYNSTINPLLAPIVFYDPKKVFKGCEIYNDRLFVTNFASGFIEIYDGSFTFVSQFTDSSLMDAGFAPHNIKLVNRQFYITFAKQNSDLTDSVSRIGLGYVDIFSIDGIFISRFANRDTLNNPWAIMPYRLMIDDKLTDVILISNLGDGKINTFTISGEFVGYLCDTRNFPFVVDGLWGIAEWQGEGNNNSIYFTSGIDNNTGGLMGKLTLVK